MINAQILWWKTTKNSKKGYGILSSIFIMNSPNFKETEEDIGFISGGIKRSEFCGN